MSQVWGKSRRFLMAGAVALFACLLAGLLVGCGGGASDEELITQAIDDELGVMVDPSGEVLEELVEESTAAAGDDLEQMGLEGTEIVEAWLDGFGYEIGDITVDGDSATAEVTITCKQLYVILMDWAGSFEDEVYAANLTSTDDIYAYAGTTMMEDISGAEPVATTVTFEFEKDGSEWSFPESDDNQQALVDAIFGGGVSASALL